MKRDLDTLLADTLFNANIRPSTRKEVLLSALKASNLKSSSFHTALEKESGNPDNINEDQRERDRNSVDESLGLKDKELRLLKGEGLS